MKSIYKFLLTLIVISISIIANGEEIKIKSFTMLMDPMTTSMQRKDLNGNYCALVKVILPNNKASFEGNLIGDCEFKTAEYWCYLSPGSKKFKIKYPGFEPLMVDFMQLMGNGVQASRIYELTLQLPETVQNSPAFDIEGSIDIKDYKNSQELTNIINNLKIYHNYNNGKYDKLLDDYKYSHSSGIKYKMEDVHIGDSITIKTGLPDYAPFTMVISPERVGKGDYNLSLERKVIETKSKIIDATTEKPLAGIKIYDSGDYGWQKLSPIAISDEDGYFTIKGKVGSSTTVYYDKNDLGPYYNTEKNSITHGSSATYFIHRKNIINRIILPKGISSEDLILSGENETVPIKIYKPRYSNDPNEWEISYPQGFNSDYLDIKYEGYKTVRIFGDVFHGDKLKLTKGNENQFEEYKKVNNKIIKETK